MSEAPKVPKPVKLDSPEEWVLEQLSFAAANNDDVPEWARDVVTALWSEVCARGAHHDDTVTDLQKERDQSQAAYSRACNRIDALQAKVARYEAALKGIRDEADKDMKGSKINHLARRIGIIGLFARQALKEPTP